MFCSNCGKPMGDEDRFCSGCGATNLSWETPAAPPEAPATPPQAPMAPPEAPITPPQAPVPPAPPAPPAGTTPASKTGLDDKTMTYILRIAGGVLGAWFLWTTLKTIMGIFNFLPYIGYGLPLSLLSLIPMLLSILSVAIVSAAMIATAAIWKPELSDKLFMGACLGVVAHIACVVLSILIDLLRFGFDALRIIPQGLLGIIVTAIPAAVFYLVTYLMGIPPLKGKSVKDFNLNDFIPESAPKAANQTAPGAAPTAAPAAAAAAPGGMYIARSKKTNRSLLAYILLTIITCGIYSYIFIYSMAEDMNDIGAGDGNKTGGLAAFILLGIITCGIYPLIWNYKLCNRMAANAPRYGLAFQENGTTYLLWSLVGAFLCGIGPFIALHFMIRNMNALCVAYNQRNGLYGG